MPIRGMTDLETLNSRYPKPAISVFKGTPKVDKNGKKVVGTNLQTRFRIHIESFRLRDEAVAGGNKFDENGDSYCEEIPIYLAYSTPDRAFPAFYEKWGVSGLEIMCDGENVVQKTEVVNTAKGKFLKTVRGCEPCRKGDSPECPLECKPSARLYFYLQQFNAPTELAVMHTSHRGEIVRISQILSEYFAHFGGLNVSPFPSPKTYGRIPFVLTRKKAKGKKPIIGKDGLRTGKYYDTDDWPVTVEVEPLWYERFLVWSQFVEARRMEHQLPPETAQALGFGGYLGLKSADTKDLLLPPAIDSSGEENAKKTLIEVLGRKLRDLDKGSEWAREMAFRRYGKTAPQGESVATKLTVGELRDFLNCLEEIAEIEKKVEIAQQTGELNASIVEVEVEPGSDF